MGVAVVGVSMVGKYSDAKGVNTCKQCEEKRVHNMDCELCAYCCQNVPTETRI